MKGLFPIGAVIVLLTLVLPNAACARKYYFQNDSQEQITISIDRGGLCSDENFVMHPPKTISFDDFWCSLTQITVKNRHGGVLRSGGDGSYSFRGNYTEVKCFDCSAAAKVYGHYPVCCTFLPDLER
jgi:hypothetical protein